MNFLKETTYQEVNYSAAELIPILESNKVVVLRDYNHELDPLDFFESLTNELGYMYSIDEDLKSGLSTGKKWIDITYDPAIKDRYRAAPVAQPLHTDASYLDIRDNIQFFYCVSQAKLGGSTTFIDSNLLVKLIEMAGEQDLLEKLLNIEITFSKGERKRVSTILWKDGDDYRFNWNYYRIDKSNSLEVKDLFEEFHAFLENRVVKSGLLTGVLLKKNDVVFFQDELVLHGRQSYFAEFKGQRSLNKGTLILNSRFHKNEGLIDLKEYAG